MVFSTPGDGGTKASPRRRLVGLALIAVVIVTPGRGRAQQPIDRAAPLSLSQALAEARQANARLPVARLDVQQALARREQARGLLYPTVSLAGDVHTGAPQDYASSDAFLRVQGRAPLYQGGELRAGLARSDAELAALQAGYRMAARDLDYAVRVAYDAVLRADSSMAFRLRAIARLQDYLAVVQGRQAAGQGVGADVLQTEQRLAAGRAAVATATRARNEASMTLNDLLGRPPTRALTVMPLPGPTRPTGIAGEPWLAIPDLQQTQDRIQVARADLQAAHAGRQPHLDLEADAGVQPTLGPDTSPYNNGQGWGTEVLLSISLPFWDMGIYRGRVAEAARALDQARQQAVVTRRAARLAWSRARADRSDLYDEYQARDHAATVARDAYLLAESVYRGGQGSVLGVLDAYDAWIQALQDRQDDLYYYRVAEASLQRWGNP